MKSTKPAFLTLAMSAILFGQSAVKATETDDRIVAAASASYVFKTFLVHDSIKTENADGRRPDMLPAAPDKTTNPADRPPTPGDAPKGDRGQTPAPTDRPPFTKPNPGGRNKMGDPQLPRTEDRPPATVAPKGRDRESMPQISPRESKPSPDKPKLELPKVAPIQSLPAPKAPQVSKPSPPVQAPPSVTPPKPDKERGNAKPGERQKKDD